MLATQKTDAGIINTVYSTDKTLEELLNLEWLLTNGRGGYASSSVVCCNTRRYHGLLAGSPNLPVNRIMGLSNCLDMLIFEKNGSHNGHSHEVYNLSTFEFNGKFAPDGYKYFTNFSKDTGVHFHYQIDQLNVRRSIYLVPGIDAAALVYELKGVDKYLKKHRRQASIAGENTEKIFLVLRPLIGLRDFHTLQKSYARLTADRIDGGLSVRHNVPGSCELFLRSPSMSFSKDRQWWFSFVYRKDRERGQEFTEDLWSPGFFKMQVDSDTRIVLWAHLNLPSTGGSYSSGENIRKTAEGGQYNIEEIVEKLKKHQQDLKHNASNVKAELKNIILCSKQAPPSIKGGLTFGKFALRSKTTENGKMRNEVNPKSGITSTLFELLPKPDVHCGRDDRYEMLCLAADQFIKGKPIANREKDRGTEKHRSTILAGYPWFADWGRDTFMSLPGLLLLTGRFEEAASVLRTFAGAVDEGMIPNRFDDYSGTAYFNSIDSSLWFINGAFEYLRATNDLKTFTQNLLPAIRWIIDSYEKGTRFDIHADSDGLITGGSEQTQLTWMDAKFEGVAFTPRFGKAVEVNALWYNNLCCATRFYRNRDLSVAKHYETMANKVKSSFACTFWNEQKGYLNDVIRPDGTADASLRPNQIFAVSLPFDLLKTNQARCVVDVVQKHLLTPYGLRSLCSEDEHYRPVYAGPQYTRDEAYHQGTVWPYLMGPFIQAYLKVNNFNRKSRERAGEFIEPLLWHLTEDGCVGQISEIFDGSPVHKPKGCFAQAWSVAELIRAYNLIYY